VGPGGAPFDPSKHPRQSGGRFGVSAAAQQQASENQQARNLREQAHDDRKKASALQAQLKGLLAQQAAAGKTTGKSKTAAKGSKSGTAKKMTTKTKKTTSKKSTSRTSKASTAANLAGQISTLRNQIHVLNAEASKLDQRARSL
jgi:chaperonin cofactor prefoldin